MSDVIDLGLVGKMVSRLQSTVEDVRQEYKGIRSSLDSLSTSVYSRFAEFNVRLSGLELGQMKLATSVDEAHAKIDRIEINLQRLTEDQATTSDQVTALRGEVTELRGGVTEMRGELTGLRQQQSDIDGKLDMILARLKA